MTENPEASVLTARRAAQHFRLFSADDAYEHLCILTLLPSLAPLHLMLADTPWPHGFGATLTNVGPLSEGFERSVASPLQPRRLCAMGRTVRSISSLSDNHSNSFQVAVRLADQLPRIVACPLRNTGQSIIAHRDGPHFWHETPFLICDEHGSPGTGREDLQN